MKTHDQIDILMFYTVLYDTGVSGDLFLCTVFISLLSTFHILNTTLSFIVQTCVEQSFQKGMENEKRHSYIVNT
ncbi:hypothetical protein QTP70_012848 [Hemibagrus guttatus]|uniref:Uncharacterized protein n=1 Tax=Hemibagrus guttatus TaxID=175788 RepID=A0AAE0UYV2_9TELE|nr:hypothetical protein QTP70_012848 [Hemibagrus guttatus]